MAIIAKVDDYAVSFSGVSPSAPADALGIQGARPGRPAHQDAADARLIEPFGEEVAVGEKLDFALREGR
jgi:hypothetical protein